MEMADATLDLLRNLQALLLQNPEVKQEAMAAHLGVSRSRASNLARLLQVEEPVKSWLWAGQISPKHVEALLAAPIGRRVTLARTALAQSLSAAQLRAVIKGQEPQVAKADVSRLEQRLGELLGTRVTISHQTDGAGQLSLAYTDLDTLEGLLERLGYSE